jgi:hypothetical protein
MAQNSKPGRPTASFEELAYSNMLIVQALVELLAEKGIVSTAQVTERVKRLKQEAKVSFPRPPEPRQAASDPMTAPVVVTAGDLVSANMVIVESLLALLVDKALLTQDELEQLVSELKQRSQQAISRKQSVS